MKGKLILVLSLIGIFAFLINNVSGVVGNFTQQHNLSMTDCGSNCENLVYESGFNFTMTTNANLTWAHVYAVSSAGNNKVGHLYYQNGTSIYNTSSISGTSQDIYFPNINLTNGSTYILTVSYLGNYHQYTSTASLPLVDSAIIWKNGLKKNGASYFDVGTQVYQFDKFNLSYDNGTIDTTNITLYLINPPDESTLSSAGTNFTVLGNINNSYLNYTWSNITYYIWNTNGSLFNQTSITANNSNITNSTLFIDLFTLGQNYIWNAQGCYSNLTYSNCIYSNNGNFTYFNVPYQNETAIYESTVYETETGNYNLSIAANPTVSSVSAYFWYNGSRYVTTPIILGNGSYKFTNSIDVPLQNTSGNKTFNWQFTFTLTDNSIINTNSSTFSQSVLQIPLFICNATYNIPYINFTTKSATNPFPLVNSTLKTAWSYYSANGSGLIKKNYTYEDLNNNQSSYAFCSNINKTILTNTQIEYDSAGYALNFYYLDNASLSNSTQNISLFLLNDSLASATVIKILDNSQLAVPNALIKVQFYDIGTGTFYLVAMGRTNFNGEDVIYLNWLDSLYRFIITDANGNVLKTTGTTKISATPTIIHLDSDFTFTQDEFADFDYSLLFQNDTNNFVLTYVKPSGLVQNVCLRVVKEGQTGNTEICNVCETSSSATLFCNVGSYGNGTYLANFYATGSFFNADWVRAYVGGNFQRQIYDLLGDSDASFYAFLFSGIVTFAMFIHPVIGVIALIIGILGSAALGFTALQWGEFVGIVIVGGIVIWLIKR